MMLGGGIRFRVYEECSLGKRILEEGECGKNNYSSNFGHK
jgi:hypothetical protein